jgi:C-terminal processing protease CtpA/Prc
MLKEKIVIVDHSKKIKLVSEVFATLIQDAFYERVKLVGQGTFGKVFLVKLFSFRPIIKNRIDNMPSRRYSKISDIKTVNWE